MKVLLCLTDRAFFVLSYIMLGARLVACKIGTAYVFEYH